MWKFSNFQPTPVFLDGVEWPTPEHAYQAMKTESALERARIFSAVTPGVAKRLGRRLTLRPNWNEQRQYFMTLVLLAKFREQPYRSQLLSTGDEILIEWNTWHDNYWGRCVCDRDGCRSTGENNLGLILMNIRNELRREFPDEH